MTEKQHPGKCLLAYLREYGLDDYGSVILTEKVRDVLGLEYPEVGTKKEFDALALAELSAVDYVRNALLNEGKYFASSNGNYRVLLPSENAQQIESYMSGADRKLHRALKLARSAPATDGYKSDNTLARILLKRESIRSNPIEVAA
jgi:hypothetical protein